MSQFYIYPGEMWSIYILFWVFLGSINQVGNMQKNKSLIPTEHHRVHSKMNRNQQNIFKQLPEQAAVEEALFCIRVYEGMAGWAPSCTHTADSHKGEWPGCPSRRHSHRVRDLCANQKESVAFWWKTIANCWKGIKE